MDYCKELTLHEKLNVANHIISSCTMSSASVINMRNWKWNKKPKQNLVVFSLSLFFFLNDPVQVDISKTFLRMKSLALLLQLSSYSSLMSICISAETLPVSKGNQRFVVYWEGVAKQHTLLKSLQQNILQWCRFYRNAQYFILTEIQHNITVRYHSPSTY